MRIMLALSLSLSACGSFPQLDGTISAAAREAPYPELTPLTPLESVPGTQSSDTDLAARIDALLARAELLREFQIGALQ